MIDKIHPTPCGTIRYKISDSIRTDDICLIFLPGLTADHRLFDKQIRYFEDKHNVFVWDAPGHAASYPFEMTFSLMDKAGWLNEILEKRRYWKTGYCRTVPWAAMSVRHTRSFFSDKLKRLCICRFCTTAEKNI
jgi:pimeloyl-ACP methyl ester carboxylesterase